MKGKPKDYPPASLVEGDTIWIGSRWDAMTAESVAKLGTPPMLDLTNNKKNRHADKEAYMQINLRDLEVMLHGPCVF